MPTYISLLRYTQQGLEKIKESPKRAEANKASFRAMGVEIKQIYLVMGRYDLVVIAEAPNDETAARVMLAIGASRASPWVVLTPRG